jgi:hypothetical protein
MVDLVSDGLATAHSQRVIVGKRVVEISHLKITEAGAGGHSQTSPSDDQKAPRLSTSSNSKYALNGGLLH